MMLGSVTIGEGQHCLSLNYANEHIIDVVKVDRDGLFGEENHVDFRIG